MKHNNWFWGVFFVLAAVFVIASQVPSFTKIGVWTIVATVLLAAVFIQSLIHLNFFGTFLSVALAYILYQIPLDLYFIAPWFLILAAVLLSIGFHIIFRKQAKYQYNAKNNKENTQSIEEIDDNNPYAKVSFGACSKYIHADSLKSGQFYTSFGALEVFFDQTQLDPTGAELYVDCSFGEIKLYFPRNWHVIDSINASLGSVKNESRLNNPSENAPILKVKGNVSFGSVEIHYV